LLWHRSPSGDLAELQRLALEALVEKLVLRKYGARARAGRVDEQARAAAADAGMDGAAVSDAPTSPVASSVIGAQAAKRARPAAEHSDATDSALATLACGQEPSDSGRPGQNPLRAAVEHCSSSRHVPAAVRSAVWQRDEARCTFVDARGVRCRATTALELHHEQPFARGGPATAENIRLRCRAHNAFAAEQDFGRDFMRARKQGATRTRRRDDR